MTVDHAQQADVTSPVVLSRPIPKLVSVNSEKVMGFGLFFELCVVLAKPGDLHAIWFSASSASRFVAYFLR